MDGDSMPIMWVAKEVFVEAWEVEPGVWDRHRHLFGAGRRVAKDYSLGR